MALDVELKSNDFSFPEYFDGIVEALANKYSIGCWMSGLIVAFSFRDQ